ncbi:MAG: hypothetical protein NE328_15275 [Lentisphaeraceae bacterium]|nr:hypothetical protein [Lentisphaeraceae bacterium]
MTSKTKKKIGHAFTFATLTVIFYCLYSISIHSTEIRNGREEVLATLDGKVLSETRLNISYRYAHGLDIHNANELPEDSEVEPDFTITHNKGDDNFVFVDKEQVATIRTRDTNFKVNVLKSFDGKITLKNNICGCEELINLMYFVGGLIVSLILIILAAGFYYSAKSKLGTDLPITQKESSSTSK